jgi:hypothetical protein
MRLSWFDKKMGTYNNRDSYPVAEEPEAKAARDFALKGRRILLKGML